MAKKHSTLLFFRHFIVIIEPFVEDFDNILHFYSLFLMNDLLTSI